MIPGSLNHKCSTHLLRILHILKVYTLDVGDKHCFVIAVSKSDFLNFDYQTALSEPIGYSMTVNYEWNVYSPISFFYHFLYVF